MRGDSIEFAAPCRVGSADDEAEAKPDFNNGSPNPNKASVTFYETKLGLKTRQVSDDLAFVDAGPISLVLSSEVGRTAGDTEVVFGTEHVEAISRAA